jgi:16S rRNA (uracil1498-N3)-methyltransferase
LHESAVGRLTELPVAQADSLMLIVGPEGGIADDEIAALAAAGATAVRLGPTVLRTSSAAAVALGALGVLTPRWA